MGSVTALTKKDAKFLEDIVDPVLFNAYKDIRKNPENAWEIVDELKELNTASILTYAKSKFFQDLMRKGNEFETLITSVLNTIEPFATFIADGYKKLKQINLKGITKNIVADDLLVKEVTVDGQTFFKGLLNDSKYTNGAPWTANQKSELIEVFKNSNNIDKPYINFEVRTDIDKLRAQGAPKNFIQGQIIRIYRDDVFKTISDGTGQFQETIKMSTLW